MKLISKEEHTLYLKDKEHYKFIRLYSNGTTLMLERITTYPPDCSSLFDWKEEIKSEEKYYANNVEIDDELYSLLSSNLPNFYDSDDDEDDSDDETDE